MIVLDVETTGTDWNAHSILSIGALDLDHPTNQFYGECRMWDGATFEPAALAINGFTETELVDLARLSEAELVRDFIAWGQEIAGNRTFAAHNVSFDYEFVRAAARRASLDFPFAKRTLDAHSLVWLHMTLKGVEPPTAKGHSAIDLTASLRYVGLPKEPSPHNALTGALCHAEVISRIAYNQKLLPEFESYDIPWQTI